MTCRLAFHLPVWLRPVINDALPSEELNVLTDRLMALLNVDEEQPASRLMRYGTRRIHLRLPHRRQGTDHPLLMPEEAQDEGGPADA